MASPSMASPSMARRWRRLRWRGGGVDMALLLLDNGRCRWALQPLRPTVGAAQLERAHTQRAHLALRQGATTCESPQEGRRTHVTRLLPPAAAHLHAVVGILGPLHANQLIH